MEKLKTWLLIWWPWVLLVVLALLGGGAVVVYTQRGLRNNNPGNIKKNGTDWEGLSAEQKDAIFFQFTKPFYGLRALARTLLSYQTKHGLQTVNDMITRWAPPIENNSQEYVDFVADQMGVDPHQTVSLKSNPALLQKMVTAIVKQENGLNPYGPSLVQQATASALT